jgi:hypothetical protein
MLNQFQHIQIIADIDNNVNHFLNSGLPILYPSTSFGQVLTSTTHSTTYGATR